MSGLDIATEAAVIEAGRVVWLRARAHDLASRLEAADGLILAIDTYDAIHSGTVSPAAWWPELEHDPQPWDTGLSRAAEVVLHQIAELIRQAPELAGDALTASDQQTGGPG